MSELNAPGQDAEANKKDAAELTSLIYYSIDREVKVRQNEAGLDAEGELGEVVDGIKNYLLFRVEQDRQVGRAVLAALESFRDPDPELRTLEAARDMQELANRVRETLGLPAQELPTDLPPLGEQSDAPQ